MGIFKSLSGVLILGAIIIHLILTPILFSSVLSHVNSSYKAQFIENVRSSSNILANQFSQFDYSADRKIIESLLDEISLGGQITYAEILLKDGEIFRPQLIPMSTANYREDFFFDQHNDQTYFISIQLNSYNTSSQGKLRLGYDESFILEQIKTTFIGVVYITAGYFLFTMFVILYLVPRLTAPLRKLRDAANKVALGESSESLQIKSRISEFVSLANDVEKMRVELVEQNQQIHRREMYISALMDNMANPMIVMNEALEIESFNPAAEKTFQFTQKEMKGKKLPDLLTPCSIGNACDSCEELKQLTNAQQIVEQQSTECKGLKKNGSVFPVEFHFSKFYAGGQRLIICNAYDLTEHKKNEQQLIRAKHDAESANQSKSVFLSSMSHELRTPLNAVIGYSEILLEEAEENNDINNAEDLTKIRNSGKHLLSLINDILDLSKIEAGKMKLDIQEFKIRGMVDDVIFSTTPLIAKANNQFELNFDESINNMFADFTKVKQALINLIGNAAKFTENGQITLSVDHETKLNIDWINFTVSDTGIGIAQEDQHKLFKEFSQVNAHVTTKYGGSGLGLAISKKFCEMMGGNITVKSVLNEGSTFTISLPVDTRDFADK